MNYESAFDLLGVTVAGSRATAEGSFRPSPYNPLTGWATKDDEGNSSVAQRNRNILDQQTLEKTREAYERDLKDAYGDDWEAESKELWGDDWDSLSKQQKQAQVRKYAPQLSSAERSQLERSRESRKEADAEQAMRDYVKRQESLGKDPGGDGDRWTHEDAEAARKEFREKEGKKDGEVDDTESTPYTRAKAALVENADTDGDGFLSIPERIDLLEAKLELHESTPDAHHEPYYA